MNLLVMPKYWGKSKRQREKEEERLNDGENNGPATHGARKPPGPKYWGKQIFAHGRFPEVGQKQKTEKKRKRKKERLNDGNNNGQATHGVRKNTWRRQAAWAKKHHVAPVF